VLVLALISRVSPEVSGEAYFVRIRGLLFLTALATAVRNRHPGREAGRRVGGVRRIATLKLIALGTWVYSLYGRISARQFRQLLVLVPYKAFPPAASLAVTPPSG
jgi:hypothetical protein